MVQFKSYNSDGQLVIRDEEDLDSVVRYAKQHDLIMAEYDCGQAAFYFADNTIARTQHDDLLDFLWFIPTMFPHRDRSWLKPAAYYIREFDARFDW